MTRALLVCLLFAGVYAGSYICDQVLWGSFTTTWDGPSITKSLDANLGRPSQIVHLYTNWDDGQQSGGDKNWDATNWLKNEFIAKFVNPFLTIDGTARSPLITWQPWGKDGAGSYYATNNIYTFDKIRAGNFDNYIDSFFKAINTAAKIVYVRPFHEFDNPSSGYSWNIGVNGNTAAGLIAAWRHVHDRKVAVGATNVRLVWCPNHSSGGSGNRFEDAYPGDSYVDWTCLDAYTTRGFSFADSLTTNTQPQNPYDRLVTLAPSKPIMIAEFGLNNGGADLYPKYFTDMAAALSTKFTNIKAIVFFNSHSEFVLPNVPTVYNAIKTALGNGCPNSPTPVITKLPVNPNTMADTQTATTTTDRYIGIIVPDDLRSSGGVVHVPIMMAILSLLALAVL